MHRSSYILDGFEKYFILWELVSCLTSIMSYPWGFDFVDVKLSLNYFDYLLKVVKDAWILEYFVILLYFWYKEK